MKRYQRMPAAVGAVVLVLALLAAGALLLRVPQSVAQDQQPLLEYPDYPPTPTIAVNPPQLSLAGTVLAASDFADPAALAGFTVVDLEFVLAESRSVWSVVDGRLTQDFTAAAGSPSIQQTVALAEPAAGDATVTVSFYDQFNGTAGLVARYQGDDPTTASYYRYRILKDAFADSPKQVLEKVVDGVATTLASVEGPGFSEREWHTLSLSVIGGQIEVRLDGTVVASASDPAPLGPGQAGIYTRAIGGILFDDFQLVAP